MLLSQKEQKCAGVTRKIRAFQHSNFFKIFFHHTVGTHQLTAVATTSPQNTFFQEEAVEVDCHTSLSSR